MTLLASGVTDYVTPRVDSCCYDPSLYAPDEARPERFELPTLSSED